jgi:triosephosphate isomerase
VPLICIGETLAEREAGEADTVLKRQVEGAFAFLEGAARTAPVLLAYEPVWAIGVNGIPATADYADARHRLIGEVAERALGVKVPVLYGGSVNPQNCEELILQRHIDGLFIGRSAWDVGGYLDILQRVARAI